MMIYLKIVFAFMLFALCLGQNLPDQTYIQLFECDGSFRQQWDTSGVFSSGGDQTIRLKTQNSMCLDISGYGTGEGSMIWLYSCHTQDKNPAHQNQEWTWETQTGNIVSVMSGLCVDTANNGVWDGTEIWIWDCDTDNSQQWYYNETDSTIRGVQSGLCLDAGSIAPRPCDSAPFNSYPYCNTNLSISSRVQDLISRISTNEMWPLFGNTAGGIASLNIPAYQWWSEALHGVAASPGVSFTSSTPCATSFPQVCTTGASFDVELFAAIGQTISTEARAFANVGNAGLTFWAPNLNIFRDPRWGRGQETPGEDPYLTSEYVRNFVYNMQYSEVDPHHLKVSSCCKHFAAYSLEDWGGNDRCSFNAIVTEQDLQDTYLPAFEVCISPDGGAASGIMCSYNAVNGIPSCANSMLLTGYARNAWEFNGYITGDCGAVSCVQYNHHYTNNTDATSKDVLSAGLDIDCGSFLPTYLSQALTDNAVNISMLQTALTHLFSVQMRLGIFDPISSQPYLNINATAVNTEGAQQLAYRAACEGVVLLKNNNNALPLKDPKSVAVIGPNADVTTTMQGNYYGTPCSIPTPLSAIGTYAQTTYNIGCDIEGTDTTQISKACSLAQAAKATIIIAGNNSTVEGEANDRVNITWPGVQSTMISTVAACSSGPVILVVMSGGPIDLTSMKNNPDIDAILWVGYPGQAGGNSIADAIFGIFSPAGRLPHTVYPANYVNQVPMTDMGMRPSSTSPGRTYRFYTGQSVYPFGFGLSYTTFTYQWVNATKIEIPSSLINYVLYSGEYNRVQRPTVAQVEVLVTNTGTIWTSDSVVLVFIIGPNAGKNGNPIKSLFGFTRLFELTPGEQVTVQFSISAYDLSVVDENGKRHTDIGEWEVEVEGSRMSLSVFDDE